jgi:hypothetical protein
MGRGGAQRPVWRVNEPKNTGARSARAHTCGQNPLVDSDSYKFGHLGEFGHIYTFTCRSQLRKPEEIIEFWL